jgi:hypothetical protein
VYTLIVDKPDIFEAKINIEGAEADDAQCRLVIESGAMSLLFEGSLKDEKCSIPIKKLKKYIKAGDTGTMKLEVIADDTFFSPWESDFKAKASRKVTAEVVEPVAEKVHKPTVVVSEITQNVDGVDGGIQNKDILIKEMATEFLMFGLKLEDVGKRKKTINHVVSKMIKRGIITTDMKDSPELIDVVLESIILSEKSRK